MRIIKLGALLGLSLAASSVYALTPGNASLTNSAKLTYDGNTDGISASVTVTVDTIGAAPDGSNLQNVSKAESQPYSSEVFTITATNNGPDTYTIVTSFTQPTGVVNGTDPFGIFLAPGGSTPAGATVELGATALQELSTSNVIKVPSDGGGADNVVNGLGVGDKVVVANITYTIATVDDSGPDFALIGLSGASLPLNLAIGTEVSEIKDLYLFTPDVGVRDLPGVASSLLVDITATPSITGTSASIVSVTINIVLVQVTKYVSNISDPNATGCAGSITISTVVYHVAGGSCVVNAKPTNTLAYLIRVITPNETGAELVNAIIGDVLPPFTTYVSASTTLNTQSVTDGVNPGAPVFPLDPTTAFADNNGGMLIQDATVPQASGAQGDGNVEINSTVDVVYQVTLQ
jgi:uncharacterized repeat protein (TIGR01451 family)